jgi:hypothetical protein
MRQVFVRADPDPCWVGRTHSGNRITPEHHSRCCRPQPIGDAAIDEDKCLIGFAVNAQDLAAACLPQSGITLAEAWVTACEHGVGRVNQQFVRARYCGNTRPVEMGSDVAFQKGRMPDVIAVQKSDQWPIRGFEASHHCCHLTAIAWPRNEPKTVVSHIGDA